LIIVEHILEGLSKLLYHRNLGKKKAEAKMLRLEDGGLSPA
jgi:hypothetical protein